MKGEIFWASPEKSSFRPPLVHFICFLLKSPKPSQYFHKHYEIINILFIFKKVNSFEICSYSLRRESAEVDRQLEAARTESQRLEGVLRQREQEVQRLRERVAARREQRRQQQQQHQQPRAAAATTTTATELTTTRQAEIQPPQQENPPQQQNPPQLPPSQRPPRTGARTRQRRQEEQEQLRLDDEGLSKDLQKRRKK